MRKIYITLRSIVLIVICIIGITRGFKAPLKVYSYSQIEKENDEVINQMNELTLLKSNEYKVEETNLKKAVADYEGVAEKYEKVSETKTSEEKKEALYGQTYDLEYLQILLGNHATDNKVDLTIEASKNSESAEDDFVLCDFKFIIVGSYSGITNFIEDVSHDDKLKFIPENLKMHSEYREVSTISDTSLAATNNSSTVNKKEKRLVLVGEFYKSSIAVKKDTILKIENKQEEKTDEENKKESEEKKDEKEADETKTKKE